LFDYKKKLTFEVLQNAVHEKPAKLEKNDTSESTFVACFGAC